MGLIILSGGIFATGYLMHAHDAGVSAVTVGRPQAIDEKNADDGEMA